MCPPVMVLLDQEASIAGGGLSTQYRALQLHLHWSEEMDRGSEHTINGNRFAMEVRALFRVRACLGSGWTCPGQEGCSSPLMGPLSIPLTPTRCT